MKLVWTREEEFTWAYFRPAGLIETAAGVDKDGKLTAWEFHNYNSGASGIATPYKVASSKVVFHATASPLRQGSYRALAATANHFARESLMDELAHAAGLDPLEFRLRNLEDPRLRAVLEDAAAQVRLGQVEARRRATASGSPCGTEKGGYIATCAEVAVDQATGSVKVVRAVSASSAARSSTPTTCSNQVEGRLIQGLGGALFEAIRFANGKILNPRFSRYRVPRFGDIPQIEIVLVDRKDLPAAGGGEIPIVAIAPAIANAIFNAIGSPAPVDAAGAEGDDQGLSDFRFSASERVGRENHILEECLGLAVQDLVGRPIFPGGGRSPMLGASDRDPAPEGLLGRVKRLAGFDRSMKRGIRHGLDDGNHSL